MQLARVRQREAEQESLDYRQWRQAEEERLFAICQAEQLDRKGLKAWQQQVSLLREKEAQLEQTAAEQAERVAEERIRLQERQQGGTPSPPAATEFAELHRQKQASQQALRDYNEEQEQEEFRQQIRM
ncbi:type III secretion protein (plasmid) [Aeromonas salmonicida subsp. salmonicida]|uniref:type III secretion system stalk subunit SctO n=1 Tax=Aeromonas salmonicida TaxID=645 RepID=UPI0022A91DD7|nr:YscO family type III secretion system apparatus protein [Aeromonas salmonicida]UYZ32324.1 type III secretion protein [Aeromonas salmonicida subsp. salmonicida]